VLRAAHPEEFPLETFVGLLEQGEDDSSCHPAETYLEVFPKVFWPQRNGERHLLWVDGHSD